MDVPGHARQYRSEEPRVELADPPPPDAFGRGSLMASMLDQYVRAVLDREYQVITAAVTLSVQLGTCGVQVTYDEATRHLVSAVLDPSVPLGEIHHHYRAGQP